MLPSSLYEGGPHTCLQTGPVQVEPTRESEGKTGQCLVFDLNILHIPPPFFEGCKKQLIKIAKATWGPLLSSDFGHV